MCNAVALARVLGWEFHRKAVSQQFADLVDTPAEAVLALLRCSSEKVFVHNTKTQEWLHDLQRCLTSEKEHKERSPPKAKCWGPKELGASTMTG